MAHYMVPVYNLDGSVGKNGKNEPEDVRLIECLIECMLGGAYGYVMPAQSQNFGLHIPNFKFKASGTYTQSLQTWIDFMLEYLKFQRYNTTLDGRFDPLPRGWKGYQYTVHGEAKQGRHQSNLASLLHMSHEGGAAKYAEIGEKLNIRLAWRIEV